jgi:hypothetical protein
VSMDWDTAEATVGVACGTDVGVGDV